MCLILYARTMRNLVGDFDSVAHSYCLWSYGRSIRIDRIDSSSGPERDRDGAKSSLPPSPSSFLILYSKMAASLCARASGGCGAKKDERNNVVSLMAGQFQRVRVAPLPLSFFPRRRGVSFFPTRSFLFVVLAALRRRGNHLHALPLAPLLLCHGIVRRGSARRTGRRKLIRTDRTDSKRLTG